MTLSGALLGGKAANLAVLAASGVPVPEWICVTTQVFEDLRRSLAPEIAAATSGLQGTDRKAIRNASQLIGQRIRDMGLEDSDTNALFRVFDATFPVGAHVAVRSSVVGEDSAKDSFAGQMDTYLYVRRQGLVERVLSCFASAYSERALAYRFVRGHGVLDLRMAVVVQRMVDSRVAGVLFTANPTTGDRTEAVVTAGLGLGEGVVGGLVDTDTFYLDLASGSVRRQTLVPKQSRIVFDEARGDGTTATSVPSELVEEPALKKEQLAQLVSLGRELAGLHGAPQDIEWAFDDQGSLFLLQARPITVLGDGTQSIFDNSNIVESYPGLSSPLTFSFARLGYEGTFKETMRLLGAADTFLAEHHELFANLVAFIDGRIYYNILNWYRINLLAPGFQWAVPAWEKALGLTADQVPRARRRYRATDYFFAARVYYRVIRNYFGLDRHVAHYLNQLTKVQGLFRSHDLSQMEAHDLLHLAEEIFRILTPAYAIAVINDIMAQQAHELVGRLIARYQLGNPSELRNELLCGEAGMESVEPVRSALSLVDLIRATPQLLSLFESELSPEDVWRGIQEDPHLELFRARLAQHFSLYGDRTLHELKLETPLAEDNPGFVVTTLRNFLRGGQNVATMEQREKDIRARAEREVVARLEGKPVRRRLFRHVLGKLRTAVRSRENMRLGRSRSFGMIKRVYGALGARFAEKGLLDAKRDIFYLTVEEVSGAVRGHGVTRDLRALVELRKQEQEQNASHNPPARITVRGLVLARPRESASLHTPKHGAVLNGIGCSPGRVTAPAKVLLDPMTDQDVRGEILVAPMTDPGWVFLMVASSGLVSEKGSPLSHTAIIGRELGIPTVVGVKDVTRIVATGQRITLDGHAGTIHLDQADPR